MNQKDKSSAEEGIRALVAYGLGKGLITEEDAGYAANLLLDALCCEPQGEFSAADIVPAAENAPALEDILDTLLCDAAARGLIDGGPASRDLFDTRLMSCLCPRPGEVVRRFFEHYRESPEAATDYFYKLSRDSDYIREYRIRKDRKWTSQTKYGTIDITINLSKPEKDPKAIAAALTKKQNAYPKCLLCPENEGYAGRLDHPARQTLRLIPLELGGERWYMQYSPYVYYNEHCIVLSKRHAPMRIDRSTFRRLMDFVALFPHYTIGSNADLPIVGGSILTHEHFQGGRYEFAMARAGIREELCFRGFEDVTAGIVNWPMSVIRLRGSADRVTELADRILTAWRGYSDEALGILAYSGDKPHNTITPIARRRGELFELDLVLRNNRTTPEFPLGVFHPHEELHHIKKENIGLIEVMGLAVLPARLLSEMERLKEAVLAGEEISEIPEIAAHAAWCREMLDKHPELSVKKHSEVSLDKRLLDRVVEEEIGLVFQNVLEHCGVYKDSEEGRAGFRRFTNRV
ncbi:UDP-glucose--hexose-1-phosphate uridylyltransferase [Lachnoclostridium sp. Marseille-P6806]|uniref:UDP-glucose--hexose-1-phosphate uridylyltransferase n=1 Tax=Lachnoclostridium sp. Marseille-P6806 TaxID=2364793 RepID=UPI001030A73F|nr:UDP-glucose--hexose-1-phosphate uridylyltransferase [Lachnoclostridium sp. Marseille-P6806]